MFVRELSALEWVKDLAGNQLNKKALLNFEKCASIYHVSCLILSGEGSQQQQTDKTETMHYKLINYRELGYDMPYWFFLSILWFI